ncbi:hypothetical protein [Flavobacterium terrigena]|nr:hypothetical protein [Flavobacterium terrigena]
MKKSLLTTLIIVVNSTSIFSQVGIGTTNPSASSALDINSTNSGLLIPRISLTSSTDVLTIPSPTTSLLVYNTATISDIVPGFYYWDTKWNSLQDSKTGTDWKVTGNAITAGNFLGTTNSQDLLFKVNNSNAARFDRFNSVTLGFGSNVTPGIIRASVLGYGSSVSSPQSIALGNEVRVSGQYATAIGYQAQTSQDYAVVLGSTNANSKIGIGTNSPDERLHVVGNIKMVDGNQANGNILRSDANGKASWESIDDLKDRLDNVKEKYGELFRTSNTTISSGNEISFGSNGPNNSVALSSTNIKVSVAGDYKVTYSVSFLRGNGNGNHSFYLRKNSTKIPGSSTFKSANNGDQDTLTKTKLVTLAAGDAVSVYYDSGDTITLFEGTSLQVELIK